MLDSLAVRYFAIVLGTVMWNVGSILQKRAVGRMPAEKLPILALVRSPEWMLGLLVTAAGWGMFVFGLDEVPISSARAATAGSYVVLAIFSTVFLKTPLSLAEWAAIVCVTGGILLLGIQENAGAAPVVWLSGSGGTGAGGWATVAGAAASVGAGAGGAVDWAEA